MAGLESQTAGNDRLHHLLAINYGGRDEIVRHPPRRRGGPRRPSPRRDDHAETVGAHSIPPACRTPTSSCAPRRVRLGFLPWQAAWSQHAFVETRWPDFTTEMLAATACAVSDVASAGSALLPDMDAPPKPIRC